MLMEVGSWGGSADDIPFWVCLKISRRFGFCLAKLFITLKPTWLPAAMMSYVVSVSTLMIAVRDCGFSANGGVGCSNIPTSTSRWGRLSSLEAETVDHVFSGC